MNLHNASWSFDGIAEDEDVAHLRDMASEVPVIRLVNQMLVRALESRASDVHIEPFENQLKVRYRIDGDLVTVHTLHKEYWSGMCQRLKIMSEMNIADKLSPQDGRFNLNIGGREADFRVSSLPTVHGENIVLRVLDKSASIVPLEKLGFSAHNRKLIEKCLMRPEGIIIVTGPTGSGKTTTLYSMLSEVNTPDVNIQTLEDPVEYSLGLIRQSNVREGAGLTFGEGVKALLRQDPDIILVGEMRDLETTAAAITAAETGHLVLSTLHTCNASQTCERIIDMYPADQQNQIRSMLANTLQAVISQCLFKRTDKKGMVPGTEVLLCTPAVRNLVRENRVFEIPNVIETNRALGMNTLDNSIAELYFNGMISREDAISQASYPEKLERMLAA